MKRKYNKQRTEREQGQLPPISHAREEATAAEIKKFLAEALRTRPKSKSRLTNPDDA
jgi:hypothetical protein